MYGDADVDNRRRVRPATGTRGEPLRVSGRGTRRDADCNGKTQLYTDATRRGMTRVAQGISRRGFASTEFAFGQNRFQPDLAVLLAAKWKEVEQSRCPVLIIPDIAVEIVSP